MIGEKLGKYTVLEVVGNGSMGTVYKAEDPEGHRVTIQLVRSPILYNREKRERIENLIPLAHLLESID